MSENKHYQPIPYSINEIPFGREPVLRKIFDRLASNYAQGAQSISIVGPPFIGKSTILSAITKPALCQLYQLDLNKIYLIYIDCNSLPPSSLETFRLFGQQAYLISTEKWLLPKQDELETYEQILNKSDQWHELTTALEGLLRSLSSTHNRCLVYVLDNFDKLLALFSERDIHFLRDIFSNYKHGLIVATPKPVREHSPKTYPSKLYDIFMPIFIKPLTIEQSFNYIHRELDFCNITHTDSDIKAIFYRTGPHPHFLTTYLSQVVSDYQEKSDEFDLMSIDTKARLALSSDFITIWNTIDKLLQEVLLDFSRNVLFENRIIRELQRLEDGYGFVYRDENGHFQIMGDLLKEFIISQAEVINQLLKSDYYRAGLNALDKLRREYYFDTDPIYFYQRAFKKFSDESDYSGANDEISQVFFHTTNVIIKRSESYIGRAFIGQTLQEKIQFIQQVFEIKDEMVKFIRDFWELTSNQESANNGDLYTTLFRFYTLSALIQYLVNAPLRSTVLAQQPGTFDRKYLERNLVGRSTHSQVEKAWDQELQKFVAIKSVYIAAHENPSFEKSREEQLLREAAILSKLDHPNIGKVYSVILNPLSIVMEWIEGDSLESLLVKEERSVMALKELDVIKIGIKLADALVHVHNKEVFHRDIKPSNIILRNSNLDPVLIDFDIARSRGNQTITGGKDGLVGYVGTFEYSAPEQFEVGSKVDGKADIFSLGIVLYELLTNNTPYQSNYLGDYPDLHYPAIAKTHISNGFYPVICSMLSEDPSARPDASSLNDQLKKLLSSERGI